MKKFSLNICSVRFLSVIVIAFLSVISIAAQRYSIRTPNGYLFIQNDKESSFSCELTGKSVEPVTTAENPAFMVDGSLIQILLVQADSFDPTGKVEISKLLETHRDWELDYLSSVFGTKLVAETDKQTVGGRPVMSWSFKRTKYVTEYDRDTYLTTLLGRDVLGLSSPATIGVDSKFYKDLHIEIIKTLKVSKTPFDIVKLSEEIKGSVKAKS